MMQPPQQLDGARVLCFAEICASVAPTGACTHRRGGEILGPAQALAICRYKGDLSFYLFYCDDCWRVQTDTCHSSMLEAKRQAEFEYNGVSRLWTDMA